MTSTRPAIKSALITGAASGIGAAFARRLAAQQVRLWLVDKQGEALTALADELNAAHGSDVNPIRADLRDPADQETIVKTIESLRELDLLINNAGFGSPASFHTLAPEKHDEMLQVHVMSPVKFCRAALPAMIGRRNGAIINVCSLIQYISIDGNAMYGATKMFLDRFSRSLDCEVRQHGVKIQALIPGYTSTRFHHTGDYLPTHSSLIPGYLWLSADEVVDVSLRKLASRRVDCVPGLVNRISAFFLRHRLYSMRLLERWIA